MAENKQTEILEERGYLAGHGGWVTTLQVGEERVSDNETREIIVSGSRDKTVCIWDLYDKKGTDEENEIGRARRILKGHSHFIQDLQLSQDGRYCLSASWDGTMRLWDIKGGYCDKRFVSHTKDVLTCAISFDNRFIASGARDKTIKIWNVVGQCKYTVEQNCHTDWISCLRFSPDTKSKRFVTASWDKTIKVWNHETMQLENTHQFHTGAINSIAFAPKSSFLASGGADGKAVVWNLDDGQVMEHHQADAPINCVQFAPKKYWLAIGTDKGIRIWYLPKADKSEKGKKEVVCDLKATPVLPKDMGQKKNIACLCMAWNKNGNMLYAGFSDGVIRAYEVVKNA